MDAVKDPSGKTLAYIHRVSDYRVEIRDTSGKTLGYYNPHLDQTFGCSGRMIGHGNLLATLLR